MSSVDVRRLAANEDEPGWDADPAAGRLDADMRHLLAVLAGLGGKRIEDCRATEARALPTLDTALQRLLRAPHEDGVGMEMRLIEGATGEQQARIYTPASEAAEPRPVILYFHDGLFIAGDVDKFDASPRGLCQRTGAIVVSAHYRQAPEYRFPAAHEDAQAAWHWLTENAEDIGGDSRRIAIVGEGSGGNLAVNVALRARDEGQAMPVHLGLVTPMAAMLFDLPSHLETRETGPVSTAALQWAARKLFRRRDDMHDARMNIAGRADLAGLPPTTLILAAADPLRSEGQALADALRGSGVWVDETVYDGVTHGFFGLHQVVNKAMFAQGQMARNLVAAFGA